MRRSAPAGVLAILVGVAVACGSDNKSGGDGGGDGAGSDSPNIDTDSSFIGSDAGGGDGSMTGDPDGAFAFDGFGKGDGNYCVDNDNDGYTDCAGDCDDNDSQINPCAFDSDMASGDPVGVDGKDNDCDGTVDNRIACEQGLQSGHSVTPGDYTKAIDVCDNAKCKVVNNAIWYGPQSAIARRVTKHMGNFVPKKGGFMAFFATGIADDLIDTPSYRTGDGTDLQQGFMHPSPLNAMQNKNPCGQGQDEKNVSIHDYTEIRLTLTAPINAGSFTFDFNFFSEEYPAYVCRGFNDTFLAMLTSKKYPNGNQIAFDPNAGRINVNNGFFQACTSIVQGDNLGYVHNCSFPLADLNNTSYEIKYCCTSLTDGNLNKGSGGTEWLRTTAPIDPGETFTISFIVFEEGDGLLDSAVNIDNFRWGSQTIQNPVTAR